MPFTSRRFIGLAMIVFALIGVILSGFAILKIWQWREPVEESLKKNIALAKSMLTTTNELLIVVDQALTTAALELTNLEESLLTIGEIINDFDPLLKSLQRLTGENLPGILASTQISLSTAQESADTMDNLLKTITRIPFFPGDPYEPEVPLSESLGEISTDLASMTPALKSIEADLVVAKANLVNLEADLAMVVDSANQAQDAIGEAQNVLNQYDDQISEAQQQLDDAYANVPKLVNRLAWVLTIIIFWLAITQTGLFFQGLSILTQSPERDQ